MGRPSSKPSKPGPKKTAQPETPAPGDAVEALRTLLVLLVDDDPVDRAATRRAIEKSRLNALVDEAGDIESGMLAIRQKPYDVIVLDHLLPDGKSADFIRRARDAGLRTPVIVATGFGDEMLVADLLKSGVADYLPKDRMTPDSLFRAVSHAIRVHRAEQELRHQDALLRGVAEAATLLHTHADRSTVVNEALEILCRATEADRAVVFEHTLTTGSGDPAISHRFEWDRATGNYRLDSPAQQNLSYRSLGFERWHAALSAGSTISGPVRMFPDGERARLEAEGVRSLLLVPIFVVNRFWGFIRLEDRHGERIWSDHEKTILIASAAAIGSALVHRRADEQLRRKEERYRAILENQVDLFCRSTPDLKLTFVNNNYCRYYGRKREELIGESFLPHIPEGDTEAIRRHFKALTRDAPINTHEHRTITPDGRIRWQQWINRAVFDDADHIVEYESVGRDITDRHDMEDALKLSEAKYRALVDQIPAITYSASLDNLSTTTFISPQIESILGYSPGEFLRNPDQWLKCVHPDDRDRVLEAATKCRQPGELFVQEYRLIRKDGATVWILDRAKVVGGGDGSPAILHGIMYNITDRERAEKALRDSEEDYRTLVENLNIAVFRNSADPRGHFLSLNSAHARILGYDSIDELRKVDIADLYADPGERAWVLDELRRDSFIRDREVRLRRKDGSLIWASISARARKDEQGNILWLDGVMEDISERKQNQQAILESREYLNTIINAIADPVFVKDSGHRFVLVNDAHCRIAGRPREEIIGKTDYDFFPRDQVNVFWKMDDELLASGRENINEESITDAEGILHTIVTKKTLYVDKDGKRFVVGVIRDITARKTAEQALQESEARYRSLAEGSPDMIYMCATDGRILYANSLGLRQFNMTLEELAGKQQEDLFPPDIAARHKESIRRVCSTGKPLFAEVPELLRHTNVWIESRLVPVMDPEGRVTAVIGFSRDVTERRSMEEALRESEANFRAVAENAVDSILILRDEKIVYANPQAVTLTGYSFEELLQAGIPKLLAPEFVAMHLEYYRARLAGKVAPPRYESMGVRKDGTRLPMEVSATRTDWKGKPAVMVIIRDISEAQKIEAERKAFATRLLEVQENERKELSALLHDHLGQLLTLTRLELGSITAYDPSSLKSIDSAVQRLDEALASVRGLAVSLRPPILDDLGLRAALETLLEELGESSGIDVSFSHKGEEVQLDKNVETSLYRVLQEALTNVVKHSSASAVDILMESDGASVRLVIKDNGSGFDTSGLESSKGIGFVGMRERVSRCGGTLTVTSTPGEGTRIEAQVPTTTVHKEKPTS